MKIKKKSFYLKTLAILAAILGLITFCVTPLAARSEYRCERVNAIFISDRITDVAYRLGAVPVANCLRAGRLFYCQRLQP